MSGEWRVACGGVVGWCCGGALLVLVVLSAVVEHAQSAPHMQPPPHWPPPLHAQRWTDSPASDAHAQSLPHMQPPPQAPVALQPHPPAACFALCMYTRYAAEAADAIMLRPSTPQMDSVDDAGKVAVEE